MSRRLLRIYTQVRTKPYRLALRYINIGDPKEVIELYRYSSYGDFVVGMLSVLANEVPSILFKVSVIDDNRFMANPQKTRRYVADKEELLYIDSPHLTEKFSRKVNDHWVATNIGCSETNAIVSAAAIAMAAKRSPLSDLKF